MSIQVVPSGFCPAPEEVSDHPEASTWLPVLIAGIESDGSWSVRCLDCGRPNTHGPEPGFRVSHCHCVGMRERRQMNGYVIAPPAATLAPYPDHCTTCRNRHGRSYIYTPVDLRASESGNGVTAGYTCDRSHGWETWWGDRPYGPEIAENSRQSHSSGQRRCALYRHYDDRGVLLYVGISENPTKRGQNHAASSEWVPYACRMEAVWLTDRPTAEAAERAAIQRERPIFNRAHALDDARQRIAAYRAARSAGDA